MADLSKITLPNNTTVNLKDAYKSGIYTVIGTQTAATGTWTGALHGVPALYDGLTIMYYLPWNGSGNATLNLTLDNGTTTGAVNCYYGNATRLTTHYSKGSNIVMTYWSAGSIKIDGTATTDNRWIANANYDSNSNTTYTIGTSGNNITLTPSSGSVQSITAPYASNAGTVNGLTVQTAVPENAVFTDHYAWTDITGKPSTFPPSSHSHSEIVTVGDQRSTATTPNDYANNIIFKGLKGNSTIGSPSTDTYSYLVGLRGWTDSSGGNSHELAFNNSGIYTRNGATTWGDWQALGRFTATPTTGQIVITDGTRGGIKSSGYTIAKSVPSDAVFTDTNVTQTISNTENSNYRVLMSGTADDTTRTEGSRKSAYLNFNPSAKLLTLGSIQYAGVNINVKTGSTKQSHITLETLMSWLITTQKLIPSGVSCHLWITTSWAYAENDILQFTAHGTNYECQLAGSFIEFIGYATAYNAGVFRLIIHNAPTDAFTPASGYTKMPVSSIAEYWCNGPNYSPVWKLYGYGGKTVLKDVPSTAVFTDTTYTFANGTNGFTVTPSGGTAQTVTVTPSITNNVTGSGTSGYIAKWNGANTITNGPAFGSATTTYLRNDGTWATPANTDTKVTQSVLSSTASAWRKVVLSNSYSSSAGASASDVTDIEYVSNLLEYQNSSGTLQATVLNATSNINANTAGSSTAGGISLYSTNQQDTYGIIFRGTASKGKHGYVQGDWATYFTMSNTANRGWVFNTNGVGNVASVSNAGHAVFNGSVTIGGNATNTSGARMEYNTTTQAIDFVFN